MDNDISNCRIENLCFLTCDENKAKGFTVDKLSKEKTHIALTLYKDFSTSLFQIAIAFNYPAKGKIMELNNEKQLIDLVYLLYDSEYEIVLNDARKILYDYKRDYTFELEKLCCADYHIEGCYGEQPSLEAYDKYIEGNQNSMIVYIVKEPIRENWTLEIKEKSIIFR